MNNNDNRPSCLNITEQVSRAVSKIKCPLIRGVSYARGIKIHIAIKWPAKTGPFCLIQKTVMSSDQR